MQDSLQVTAIVVAWIGWTFGSIYLMSLAYPGPVTMGWLFGWMVLWIGVMLLAAYLVDQYQKKRLAERKRRLER